MTTTFTYANSGWKDRLIAVNDVELTYDEIGNVLTYGDREYTWESGRNLAGITDGDNSYSYTYDENGIRTSKTVNGVTTYYNTKDGVILSQTDGTNTMYFQYDTNGIPLGFILNGAQYLYLTNQMGDVISITDAQGNELVQYEYDEWGAIGSITTTNNTEDENTLANVNPLRYRGYYYDAETGYYYLQSRYYDPSICRFINADDYQEVYRCKSIVDGLNLFVYCYNIPLNSKDSSGYGKEWIGFIVYSKPGSDFKKQANYMKNKMKGYNTATFYCISAKDFIDAWNSFAKNYKLKDLFLYVHGGIGKLYFKNCQIYKNLPKGVNRRKKYSERSYTFSKLNNLNITGKIYLNSCHGGTSKGVSESVASILAKKAPSKTVRAVVNGKVYYPGYDKVVLSGNPYTKEKGAYWADFNYHYVNREKKKLVCISNKKGKWSL